MVGMEGLLGMFAGMLVVVLIIAIAIYVLVAIFLNKFNKLVYGKGTALAWIPICNIYLLGKLTVNKLVGWILVICSFLSGSYSVTVDGETVTKTVLPGTLGTVVSNVYSLAVLGLFIYAIVKYFQLKKEKKSN